MRLESSAALAIPLLRIRLWLWHFCAGSAGGPERKHGFRHYLALRRSFPGETRRTQSCCFDAKSLAFVGRRERLPNRRSEPSRKRRWRRDAGDADRRAIGRAICIGRRRGTLAKHAIGGVPTRFVRSGSEFATTRVHHRGRSGTRFWYERNVLLRRHCIQPLIQSRARIRGTVYGSE